MSRITARSLTLAASAALVASSAAIMGAPAYAALPNDPTFTPVAADLVGAGSDTTEIAVNAVAQDPTGWNATKAAANGNVRIASYQAAPQPEGGQIALPDGTSIVRPNGSGAGKALLYGAANNANIDFARSSSALNAAEVAGGLQAFPFAVDRLTVAVSNSVTSNAPAALTIAQIADIYRGKITDWSQVGGTAGKIVPIVPQSSSGTRQFFDAQLKAAIGLAATDAFPYAPNVNQNAQEHDDTLIKGDANAIAPFSVGRARLLGTTLRLDNVSGGFSVDRAVYNVVRGADVAKADIQAVFGPNGFFCSPEARDLISKGGLEQLSSTATGGVCGTATQSAVSNFATSAGGAGSNAIATTTTLTGTASGTTVTLVAKPAATTGTATGTVSFFEGTTLVANNVPLVSTQATAQLKDVAVGAHTYRAVFNPTFTFAKSESAAVTVNVLAPTPTPTAVPKVASTTTASFPKAMKVTAKKFKKAKLSGKATVVLPAPATAKATGNVVFKVGSKSVTVKLSSTGTATVSVPVKSLTSIKKLTKAGKKGVTISSTVSWAGDTAGNASTSKAVTTKLVLK